MKEVHARAHIATTCKKNKKEKRRKGGWGVEVNEEKFEWRKLIWMDALWLERKMTSPILVSCSTSHVGRCEPESWRKVGAETLLGSTGPAYTFQYCRVESSVSSTHKTWPRKISSLQTETKGEIPKIRGQKARIAAEMIRPEDEQFFCDCGGQPRGAQISVQTICCLYTAQDRICVVSL